MAYVDLGYSWCGHVSYKFYSALRILFIKRADSTRTAYLLNRYYAIPHEQLPWCIYCKRWEEVIVSTSSYRMHNQFTIKTWKYQVANGKICRKRKSYLRISLHFFFLLVNFTTYAYFFAFTEQKEKKKQKQRSRIRRTSEVVAWAFNLFSPT